MAEQEINLVDFVRVLFKKKLLILFVVGVFFILGIVFSLVLFKGYEGSVVFEIGKMEVFNEGTFITFLPETTSQVKQKINSRVYDDLIESKVEIDEIEDVEAFISEEAKDSNIVTVRIKSKDSVEGVKYLGELGRIILSQHEIDFKKKESSFKTIVSREKAKLAALEKNKDLSSLQYLYVEHLSKIDEAQMSLNSIQRTKIVRPAPEELSYENNLYLNVILSIFIGLFFGVIFAFVLDFWQRNKKEILKG